MSQSIRSHFAHLEELHKKSVDSLIGALKDHQLPGFEYFKFKQSLNKLKAMNLDEETALKSAFATASTLGITVEKLIKTARHYQHVLSTQKAQFDSAHQKQVQEKIAARQEQKQEVLKKIQECKDQISKLEKLIKNMEDKLGKLEGEMATSTEKIEHTKSEFEKAYTDMHGQIENDIQRFEKVLS